MRFPIHITTDMIRHQAKNALRGRRRFPFVLMLEPLYACNLACIGCAVERHTGKLKDRLSLERCLQAADDCAAPVVSICGGEPTIYPELPELVAALIARRRHIYLCTNALLLEQKLDDYEPDQHLSFSVHMDGPRAEHNLSVARDGVYDTAVSAIRAALRRGFRVTTNTTLFDSADPERMLKNAGGLVG